MSHVDFTFLFIFDPSYHLLAQSLLPNGYLPLGNYLVLPSPQTN